MQVNVQALCVHESGWLGTISCVGGGNTANLTPAATGGVYSVLDALQTVGRAAIDVSFSWALLTDGRVTLTCDTAFTLALPSSCAERLGWTSTSYGSSTTHTAESTPPAALRPYADDQGGVWVALHDVRLSGRAGVTGNDQAWRLSCPATRPRRPQLRFAVLRSDAQLWLTAWQRLATPAKVDTYDGEQATSMHVARLSAQEQSAVSGWTTFDVEVLR